MLVGVRVTAFAWHLRKQRQQTFEVGGKRPRTAAGEAQNSLANAERGPNRTCCASGASKLPMLVLYGSNGTRQKARNKETRVGHQT